MKGNRGFAAVVVYAVVAAVGLFLLVPSWHLPAFLQKKPPTKQLSAAEVQLKQTQAELDAAKKQLADAQAAEAQKKQDQLAYTQEMTTGAAEALSKVPAAHRTPEVILAEGFVTRANNGLDAAIGKLPADQQAEMKTLVAKALSAKQSEVDAANAQIAAMDKQLATETAARQALDKQLPTLQASVNTAQAQVTVKQAEVDKQTALVSEWADKKAEAEAKAGSLKTYGDNLIRWLIIIGILYLVIHFILPSLAAEFPAFKILDTFYRGVTSIFSAHALAPVTVTVATPPATPAPVLPPVTPTTTH